MPFQPNFNNGEAWTAGNSPLGLSVYTSNFNNGSFWNPDTNPTGDTLSTIITKKGVAAAGAIIGQSIGVPQISQFADGQGSATWHIANPKMIQDYTGIIKYYDYRSSKDLPFRRIDGTSAATRKSIIGGIYAAASIAPTGVYSIFNLDGAGKTGRGWGDHDNPNILRNDFTAMSNVNTKWRGKAEGWKATNNPAELITPFTGDKVQVIDFGKRKLDQAYRWKTPAFNINGGILGKLIDNASITQDFIKFMLTGPKLRNASLDEEDDIIIFRAIIDSLEDSFNPSWSEQKIIGRADPNYIYQGVSRSVNVQFKVFATTRDEMKPIWRKLNALAGYTAPTYNSDSIAPEAPWMRITIGDLFHQQAVVINSLSYTLHSQETTWETNIEKDPEMFELPHYVTVNLDLKLVTDVLPQKGGKFYALNKWSNYASSGNAIQGNENWLSDIDTELELQQRELTAKRSALPKTNPLAGDGTFQGQTPVNNPLIELPNP